MNSEYLYLVGMDGFLAFVACFLYSWGGQQGKWKRRFIASFVLALAANLTAVFLSRWSWPYLLFWPCLIGGFSLGYGADTFWAKFIKRTVFALGVCFCGVIGLWMTGFTGYGWGILISQILLSGFSVYLGTKNPYSSARVEEYLICQVLVLTIPFWPFVR
jgi:hypothetical protein